MFVRVGVECNTYIQKYIHAPCLVRISASRPCSLLHWLHRCHWLHWFPQSPRSPRSSWLHQSPRSSDLPRPRQLSRLSQMQRPHLGPYVSNQSHRTLLTKHLCVSYNSRELSERSRMWSLHHCALPHSPLFYVDTRTSLYLYTHN
jgi:hypothetical protein